MATAGALALAAADAPARADEPAPAPAGAEPGEATAPEPEPPPKWSFKDDKRPIKVMVLAGSIGAWPQQPYAERIMGLCQNVEVRNLSKTGFGALQLKQRFRQQVLENPKVRLGRGGDPSEYWLVYQGGLNSVASPESTNHHMRELFVTAHAKGISVVALSLTPWGDEGDRRRWAGINGLAYRRFTQAVVDFTLGRLSPREALGDYTRKRAAGADAPWQPGELPDVAVDLYRAPLLRDAEAPLRDVEAMRRELARDPTWKRRLAGLGEAEREARIAEEAARAAELPRWFLRPELRSFDHIHPNSEGHRRIAELACPHLPANWGCACPPLPPGADGAPAAPAAKAPESAVDQVLLPFYPLWIDRLLRLLVGDGDPRG